MIISINPLLLFLGKIIFYFTLGIYVLVLPSVYFILPQYRDILMPYEVILCSALSFISFIYSGITLKKLINTIMEKKQNNDKK